MINNKILKNYNIITKQFIVFILLFTPFLLNAQVDDGEKICKKIYSDIVSAIGNNSPIPPQFIYDKKSNGKIAYIRNNKIHFEQATFEALSALGENQKDGVAFILAHELAHHYLNHRWMKVAGYAYTSTEMGELLKQEGRSKEQNKMQEAQADFYAGFYSHIAGYNSMPIAGNVLDIIYSDFNIDSNIVGYPSLYERKIIIKERLEEHENLIRIFDAANIAFLTGNYDASISCYNYILTQKFTSREIFNNMGLSQLYQSLSLLSETSFKFYLPTQLDEDMRAINSHYTNMTEQEKKDKAKEFLESSLYNFNTSLSLDKEYITARKNKISALVILASIDSTYQVKMFHEIENLNVISTDDKNNLLGIYYAITGNEKKAKKYFKKSIKSDNLLAKLNIGNLQEINEDTTKKSIRKIVIDNIDLEDIVFRGNYYKFRRIPNVKLKIMNLEHSVIYKFSEENIVQVTNNNDFKSQPKIDKNISNEGIISKYGYPKNIFSSFNTIHYIYGNFIYTFDKSTKKIKKVISFI